MSEYLEPRKLRSAILHSQRTMGPTAVLLKGLYEMQSIVVQYNFPDAFESKLMTPVIALQWDADKEFRGRYDSVGPIGLSNWITLNPNAFATGADMVETLVHELAHWYCDQCGWKAAGHGAAWQGLMLTLLGIKTDDKGNHTGYTSEWYDLHAEALELGLDKVLLT